MKSRFPILLAAAALLLPARLAQANTIIAASTSYADVNNACQSASPGDTVLMPAGTNVWYQTLSIPAGISLSGSGTNQTTIACGAGSHGNIVLIACSALTANNVTRISNFTIEGTNVANNYDEGCIWMNSAGTASMIGRAVPWRIDHIVFNGIPMNNLKVYNVHSGLVDDCVFNITRYLSGQIIRLVGSDSDYSGSYSYSIPYPYGGTQALYVENCYFNNTANYLCGLCDADAGGSVVFRYNTIYNCQYNNHGTEGTTFRAQRSFEIYNNLWVANDPNCIYNPAMLIRGGTGIIYSNTVVGWKYVEQTFVKRMQQWCTTVDGADGVSPFDSNSPTVFLQGVWSGPTTSANQNYTWLTSDITFSNIVPWTPNQWAGYTVLNTHAPYYFTNDNKSPVYWFGTIVANTSNTLSVVNPKNSYADQGPQTPNLTFNPGDTYQFRKVFRTLDQIGLGSGDYLGISNNWSFYDVTNGGLSIPPLGNEADEPLYWWSNTLNGVTANFDNCGFAIIQQNRDYFNDTPRPGYTPLAYPYPLTGLTNSSAGSTNIYVPPTATLTATATLSSLNGPVTNGLVAWYQLAGDLNDYSGHGNNGSPIGSTAFVVGPSGTPGSALGLNGSSQAVSVPSSSTIAVSNEFTITAWVYFSSIPTRAEIVNKGLSGSNNGLPASFELYLGSDLNPGNLGLAIGNGTGSYDKIASGSLAPKTWYFVAATLDGGSAMLYTNGVLLANSTLSANCTDGGGNLMIGNNNQGWNAMGGSVAQVRLYNRALSTGEVAAVYANDLSGNAGTTPVINLTPPTGLKVSPQ